MLDNIGILVGGIGEESPISLSSGKFLFENFPRKIANVFVIYLHSDRKISIYQDYSFCKGTNTLLKVNSFEKKYPLESIKKACFDYGFSSFSILPMVHGIGCEDGEILSLFDCLEINYVGFDAKSSMLTFDKVLTKLVLKDRGIPVLDYKWYLKKELAKRPFKEHTIFIKPSRQGSSLGVNKVTVSDNFQEKLSESLEYDSKILIEPECLAREIECAVIEVDGEWLASPLGELSFCGDFYSFEEKYKSSKSFSSIIYLEKSLEEKIKKTAIKAVKILGGSGFARVDFFLKGETFYINEINSLPGMTPISMFPTLISKMGIDSKKMIYYLIKPLIDKKDKFDTKS